jgi:hypothetical protein
MKLERLKHLAGLKEAATEVMKGTNCSNCQYIDADESVRIEDASKELNKQGGSIPADEKQMKMAKEGDLITMPGKAMPTHKVACVHPKIKQYVTERMCCAYWDAPGTLRAYGEQAIGKGEQK